MRNRRMIGLEEVHRHQPQRLAHRLVDDARDFAHVECAHNHAVVRLAGARLIAECEHYCYANARASRTICFSSRLLGRKGSLKSSEIEKRLNLGRSLDRNATCAVYLRLYGAIATVINHHCVKLMAYPIANPSQTKQIGAKNLNQR